MASLRQPTANARLGVLGRLILRHPRLLVAVAVTLAILGGWLAATRLVLDADTNHLIAADRPFKIDFDAWLAEFGDLERIHVAVDAGNDDDLAARVVRELVTRLEDRDDLPTVHGWIPGLDQWRLAPRALPDEELAELVRSEPALALLAGPASPAAVLKAGTERLTRLDGPHALQSSDADRRDLGGSGFLLLGALAAAADDIGSEVPDDPVGLGGIRPDRPLQNPGGRLRFIEILPRKEFGSLAAIAEPLAAIRSAIAEVAAAHPGVEIGVTGKPVLQADELATSDADMTRCAAGALAIIAVLLVRAFRGWRRPLLMVAAFAIAFGWTYGAATLLVGRLNLLSIVFMLVLVGVGLDYGVHVLSRWIDRRRDGLSIEDTVDVTMRTAAVGNLFGAATSAGVFLLAILTDFGGLRELGVIAGAGLLLCMVAMNMLLPAMLVLDDRRSSSTTPRVVPPPGDPPPLAQEHAPADRGSAWILGAAAIVTLVLGTIVASRARFQDNLLELQAEGLESVEWEHRVLADSTSASWFAASIADSMGEVERITAAAANEPLVGEVRSVLDLVRPDTPARDRLLQRLASIETIAPPEERSDTDRPIGAEDLRAAAEVAARLADLARLAAVGSASDLAAVAERLSILAEAAIDDPHAVRAAIAAARDRAREAVTAMIDGAAADLRDALPAAVRDRLVSPGGRFMISLVPAEDIWSPEPMGRFVEAIRRLDPGVTGVPITQFESLRDMRSAFLEMSLGAAVLVGFFVWLDFRSVRRTLAVMTVLAIALLWTIGTATLLGVHLNVANFFAIPILIGLGVDGAIHLLHRVDECGDGPLDLGGVRRAVALTAVTTGIGFGSLIFARHRGLESLGVVMAVGSLSCLIATLVILPALVRVGWRGRE